MTSTPQSFLGQDFGEGHARQDGRPAAVAAPARVVSTEIWVQITLCVIVAGLLLAVVGIPTPRSTQEEVVGEHAAYALKITLAELRTSIENFRLEHGVAPREVTGRHNASVGSSQRDDDRWSIGDAIGRRELMIDQDGAEHAHASPADFPFWPYLTGSFPTNTINAKATVRVLRPDQPWPDAADDSTGWMYQPSTGEIRPNSSGTVFGSEVRYFDL